MGLLIFSLIFSPLARASWDLWAQTLLHLAAVMYLAALCLKKLFTREPMRLPPKELLRGGGLLLFWNILSALSAGYPHQAILETFNLANGLLISLIASRGSFPWEKGRILLGAVSILLVLTSISQSNAFRIAKNLPMVNPNILAGYLAACSVAMLEGALEGSSRRDRILFLITLALCLFGIVLAKSIGGFLAATAGASFWFGKRIPSLRKKLLLGGALIIFGVGLFKLSTPEGKNRVLWWKTALRITQAHPVLGVGQGGYEHAHLYFRPHKGLNTLYPHSEPLRVASETGLVGLVLWILFLGMILRRASQNGRSGPASVMLALLFHNLYDYSLSIFACQILFWAAAGWALRHERESLEVLRPPAQIARAGLVLAVVGCLGLAVWIGKIFLANRHTAQGEIALAEKRVSDAKAHFEKAMRLWPLNPQDYLGLARVHLGPPEEPLEIRRFLEEAKALDRYGLSMKKKDEPQ